MSKKTCKYDLKVWYDDNEDNYWCSAKTIPHDEILHLEFRMNLFLQGYSSLNNQLEYGDERISNKIRKKIQEIFELYNY